MTNKLFGETGSRKRKTWIGISAFITLIIVYQMGYNSGTRSTLGTLEHLATVLSLRETPQTTIPSPSIPQEHRAVLPLRELTQTTIPLPPVPSFSSLSPLTGRAQPSGGGTATTRPATPCNCGCGKPH